MDLENVPELEQFLVPSTIITRFGQRIGIIGYLSRERDFKKANNIEYNDEILSIK